MLELFVRILKSINFTIKYFYFSEAKIYIQPKCKKKRTEKGRTDIGVRLRFLLNHVKNWIKFSSDRYLWLQIRSFKKIFKTDLLRLRLIVRRVLEISLEVGAIYLRNHCAHQCPLFVTSKLWKELRSGKRISRNI